MTKEQLSLVLINGGKTYKKCIWFAKNKKTVVVQRTNLVGRIDCSWLLQLKSFIWFDSLRPSEHYLVMSGRILLYLVADKVSSFKTQHSDSAGVRLG